MTIHVVVGGQYGSEGKGAIAAHLCRPNSRPNNDKIKTAIRVAGPNAGHSAIDPNTGTKWALRQIPVAAVVNYSLRLSLAAGSEIDLAVLEDECERLEEAGIPIFNRLSVDHNATIIEASHLEAEGGYGGPLTERLGSTAKGVGAARAERIWRRAKRWQDVAEQRAQSPILDQVFSNDETDFLQRQVLDGQSILIEGTQGYALGVHGQHYPQCTSSDCRAIDFLAMAGVNPWDAVEAPGVGQTVIPWVVLRTFPIRVAGNSGPLKNETTWEAMGAATNGYIKPEKTTVTQVVRRVGHWDHDLAWEAVRANGLGTRVALTFFDYWYPELAGATQWSDLSHRQTVHVHELQDQLNCRISLLGTGPDSVIEVP